MENNTAASPAKRFHFEWLFPFLFSPRKMAGQVAQKRATWLTPLLVVSLLIAIRVWLAVPAAASVSTSAMPPAGSSSGNGNSASAEPTPLAGDLPVEQVTTNQGSPIIPAIGAVISFWGGWLLFSILLYIGMVASGSHNTFTETLNLVGWSSLPLGIRQIPLLITSLAIPTLSANAAGLSSLAASMSEPGGMFLTALLKLIDIYLIWQVILILLGLGNISPLPARRALGMTLGALALFLILAAMPGFFTAILTQLTEPVPGTY